MKVDIFRYTYRENICFYKQRRKCKLITTKDLYFLNVPVKYVFREIFNKEAEPTKETRATWRKWIIEELPLITIVSARETTAFLEHAGKDVELRLQKLQ